MKSTGPSDKVASNVVVNRRLHKINTLTLSDTCENSVDLDETELSHQDQHCLLFCFEL